MRENFNKTIREEWFQCHKATLTQHGNLQVLDWRRPNTGYYAVRYIFDRNMLYISGDLGDAIFRLSGKASVHQIADYNLDYLEGKMTAFSDNRRDFDQEKATRYLEEWVSENPEYKFKHNDTIDELFKIIRYCSSIKEWETHIYNYSNELPNAWEWLPNIGNIIPIRIHAYLIGIKMANEQLNREIKYG
jgi:hypothetical protein